MIGEEDEEVTIPVQMIKEEVTVEEGDESSGKQ
jgi:hypothetical protein